MHADIPRRFHTQLVLSGCLHRALNRSDPVAAVTRDGRFSLRARQSPTSQSQRGCKQKLLHTRNTGFSVHLRRRVHLLQNLLAPHPDVTVVFLLHQFLQHAHHGIGMPLHQQIDHLGAHSRVVILQ